MKSTAAIRAFLALTGVSLFSISYTHGQTILADSYLTTLDVSSPTTLFVTPNFPSFLNGPLIGSSDLTITGFYANIAANTISPLNLVNSTGNTFTGNIIIDSGILRIAGSPFATSGGGFVAASMTSSDTITINRAGLLNIDDNVSGGYTANRFGTTGDRPAVNLAGGTINLNGLSNASSSIQTFGALTSSSGQGTLNVSRNAGNPTLTFSSLAINSGSLLSFNGTALGTGTNDSRIIFTSAPALTNGILAGARFYSGSPGTSELVTYGANGVTTFTAYDLSSNDINAATATQNVQIPLATSAVTLTGDVAVNSLNFAGNGPWSLGGNKLTITSGMFLRNGSNGDPTITNGTLTAGDGINDIDLNIIVAQNNTTIQAVIADNSASAVTLVKSGDGRTLTLNGGANNTYTGGTYLVGGSLSLGNVANRTYLGTGKVTVDGVSDLTLGSYGATSNASGDDFKAINTGRINIANVNHGGNGDTFNIGANSIISGSSGTGTGLASLTRGTNITLAENAVIGHGNLTAALNLTTGTIQNLGTNADLYFGTSAGQSASTGAITIGNATAFKGISGMRNGNNGWTAGIINVATGTTDVYFQSQSGLAYTSPDVFTLGNGSTAGGIVITPVDAGTLDVNLLGRFSLNETAAAFGNTGTGRNVRFVVTAGTDLGIGGAAGMGSGTGIASALVQNGAFIRFGQGNTATDSFNGAVTVDAGGRFDASLAGGLTGTGQLTFNEGSIINIANATGWSGAQAAAASVAAGTIVRVGVNNPGTSSATLDSFFGSNSPIYQLTGSDIDVPEPVAAGTTTLTLNKNGSGVGGILTNGLASTYFRNNVNGQVTIGANGGVIAATSNTELQMQETIVGTGVTLTIGTTAIIDGAPKLGSVALGSAVGSNGYTGQTIINAGSLRTGYNNVLGALTNQITVNTGGTLNVNGTSQTVGNLTGTGGAITLGNGTLIIGQGDNGGGNYQGSIQGSGGKLTKTGTGTITLSGGNTYTGVTTASGGVLKLDHATALPGGIANTGGLSNLTINGGGIVGLTANTAAFGRGLGTGVTQVQWTGSGGFAAFGGTRTVSLGGGSINWGAASFLATGQTLILGSSVADGTVDWQQAISMAGQARTVQVNDGFAEVDAIMSGTIAGGVSGTANGFTKTGTGTLALTSNSNSYWGPTTVSDGTLTVGNGGATGILSSNSATIAVASGATLTVNRNNAVSQAVSGGLGNGAAVISGDGGFTQAGGGTTTLTLTNTYTGATTVNAGELLVNGSTSSTSLVTVNTGGTLGGTGTVGGSVTLNDGAFLSPGASIESLATGSNTWNGGSTFIFEFSTDGSTGAAGTEWDLLAITGTLDLTGASAMNQINFDLMTMADATNSGLLGTWNPNASAVWSGFVTTTSGITGFAANLFNIDTTSFQNTTNGSFSIAQSGNNLNLIYTAVPEPRAALLGGLGMLMLLRRRRA